MLKLTVKSLIFLALALGFPVVNAFAQRQPTQQETEAFRYKPCTDPWINFAYAVEFGRSPVGEGNSVGECNTMLYRDGSWSSYKELRDAVVSVSSDFGGKLKLVPTNNQFVLVFKDFDGTFKVGIVGTNSGHLISKDSASISNIVLSNNRNNILTDQASGVINGNGSTMTVVASSRAYTVQTAGARKVITLRNGAKVVIR